MFMMRVLALGAMSVMAAAKEVPSKSTIRNVMVCIQSQCRSHHTKRMDPCCDDVAILEGKDWESLLSLWKRMTPDVRTSYITCSHEFTPCFHSPS